MTHTGLMWLLLVACLVVAFVVDQRLRNSDVPVPSLRRSAVETAVWTLVGLAFVGVAWPMVGGDGAVEYLTGYTLERSLSLDNVAVFAVVVASLGIPITRQRRLIDHAILAAILLRLAFIAGGLALLEHVHQVMYVFGAILLVSGLRMFRSGDEDAADAGPPRMVAAARRLLGVSEQDDGERYVLRSPDGRRRASMLLVALVALALVDVLFAVDSVPAIFSVTRDAWIVSAANCFALLGMRPMYFLLAEGINRLVHLQKGLAVILVGIGIDMIIEEQVAVPTVATLGFVVVVLGVSIVTSLRHASRQEVAENTDSASKVPIRRV